jgi:hypothetical protein
MMLVRERNGKTYIHCLCGRNHGVLDEHFERVGFSENLPQGVVEIERNDRTAGQIVRIAKIACKCGMRARFAESSSICKDTQSRCPACGMCVECGCCACRDENPLGSYR